MEVRENARLYFYYQFRNVRREAGEFQYNLVNFKAYLKMHINTTVRCIEQALKRLANVPER